MKVTSVFCVSLFLCMINFAKTDDDDYDDDDYDDDDDYEDDDKYDDAMDIMDDMEDGIGGITIATYGGKFSILIINETKYVCPGKILVHEAFKSDYCTKPLSTNLTSEMKACSENSFMRVNDKLCFGVNTSMVCTNGDCKCKGSQVYTLSGLRSICGANYGTDKYAKFIYYPDKANPKHIPIPNSNEYVTCQEGKNAKFKCTWYGDGFI